MSAASRLLLLLVWSARAAPPRQANTTGGETTCFQHLRKLADAASVVRILHSSGSVAVLENDVRVPLGQFNRCLLVEGPDNSSSRAFETQRCLVFVYGEKQDTWVVCWPVSCGREVLQDQLEQSLLEYRLRVQHCTTRRSNIWDAADISFAVLMGVLLICVAAFTAYDIVACRKNIPDEETAWRTWLSVLRNCRQLTSAVCPGLTLASVHGLRFLSAMWVLLSNTYRADSAAPAANPSFFHQLAGAWWGKPITFGGSLAADTFLLLSGTLTCYCFLRDRSVDETFKPINVAKFYACRIVRVSVVYWMVLGLQACVLGHLGAGPLWDVVVGQARDSCRTRWWRHLLFLNNYSHDMQHQCMAQSWALAADMQLFVLSPVVLYLLWKWTNYTRIVLVTSAVLCVTVQFSFTYASAIYDTQDASWTDVFPSIETWPLMRVIPYFAGISLGYVLHCTKCPTKLTIWIPQGVVAGGWLTSALLSTAVVLLSGVYPRRDYPMTASCLASICPLAWSLSLAWLLFACEKGYGGPVYSVLSWRGFQPLGKLCYGVFLLQDMLFLYRQGSARSLPYYSHFSQLERILGDAVILLVLSAVLYVTVELPSISLCKYWLKPVPRRGSNSSLSGVGGHPGLARNIQFLSNDSFSLRRSSGGADKKTSPAP